METRPTSVPPGPAIIRCLPCACLLQVRLTRHYSELVIPLLRLLLLAPGHRLERRWLPLRVSLDEDVCVLLNRVGNIGQHVHRPVPLTELFATTQSGSRRSFHREIADQGHRLLGGQP